MKLIYTLITALALSTSALAAQPPLSEAVKTFWDCDFVSTQTVLDPGTAAGCSEAFEQVKAEKFKGDATALLAWWKANKDAEHKKRLQRK